jgi:hypothetical protein
MMTHDEVVVLGSMRRGNLSAPKIKQDTGLTHKEIYAARYFLLEAGKLVRRSVGNTCRWSLADE